VSEQFDVLVVDPPWAYGADTGRTRTAERHYRTIGNAGREINRRTGEGVQAIVDSAPIREWAAPNAHLYLWTTNPKLPFAFVVMEAWGFVYKTTITWVKITDAGVHRGGMGWFFRGATEHVLFGVRGHRPIPASLRQPNVILAKRGEHSEKPDEFYSLVESVSPGSRIDVFARKQRPGWTVWGDEVEVSR
jgi:N6-adenosine-specific RNA methylase IME4